jgi:hypothetical protein
MIRALVSSGGSDYLTLELQQVYTTECTEKKYLDLLSSLRRLTYIILAHISRAKIVGPLC